MRKYKYSVQRYFQSGSIRGTWSGLITARQTDFTNRREAEKSARDRNRENNIDVETAETIFAVRDLTVE